MDCADVVTCQCCSDPEQPCCTCGDQQLCDVSHVTLPRDLISHCWALISVCYIAMKTYMYYVFKVKIMSFLLSILVVFVVFNYTCTCIHTSALHVPSVGCGFSSQGTIHDYQLDKILIRNTTVTISYIFLTMVTIDIVVSTGLISTKCSLEKSVFFYYYHT